MISGFTGLETPKNTFDKYLCVIEYAAQAQLQSSPSAVCSVSCVLLPNQLEHSPGRLLTDTRDTF
ncbi:hypothetical protein SAMN04515672_0148 [Natronorubrum texcoconense]|uniref:Uncharacterized protein n=1 Tax=Natronorubrum texcoconense TaxID=1095776 RepID=A0A1G9H8W3_9EURY|nr:hypothetical protein SAMN04515672_0148 [Natronorubrum texcoconense]